MKHFKLFFALFAMLALSVGNAWGAALGDGYEKVTNISNLTTGDRVVIYADAISKGVTGWNGSKDATVAASGWVEYLVEVASGGVYLKDETAKNYIASPGSSNQFKYGTKAVCSVDANGVLKCNNRLLCQNGSYYRMYGSVGSYKPFYVYKVVVDAGGDETEDLGDALKWSATSATVQMGADDNEYPTLTNDKNVDVIYSSESEAVATIDANGVVTLVKEGTTTISALYEGGEVDGVTYSAKNVSYTLTVKPAPLVIEPIEGGIIDILTHKTFAATSSSYTNFTGKQATNENHSDAVYAGRSSRNGNSTQYSVQLTTIDKGRIATTTSGGLAKRVYVKWSTQATINTNARELYIYGSNTAFTGSETTNPSTKIGAIKYTTGAAEAYVDLTGDYKYILMTGSGAIYMDEIQVTWVVAEGTVTTPTISGADEFIESTEVTIDAENGLKVYYTLDGTDPTNASTEYTAPFELTATTTIKAVAYDGEKASDIISKTFKQLQVLTCEEAAARCTSTESADKYVIRGYVTNVKYAYNEEYKTATFWIADTKDGGQVLQAYSAKPVAEIDKAVKVGDYVEAIGNLKLYNETPEITNGTYTIIPAPVVNHTITVSANPADAGTVTGGGEFEETDEITVKATANEGYEFVNWTEGEEVVSTDAEYTFEVLADHNLVANFKKLTYTVTATATNGTVTGLVEGGIYEHGATATLTATPAEGYEFVKWTENEVEVSTDAEYTFEVLADRAIVANFELIPPTKFTVTVTAENGTVEGAGEYEEGAEATLTATAAEGYKFVNWTVGETVVSTENPYKFTVTADVSLVANFEKLTYTVTATATNGTVEGAGTYEHAAEVTLTATANEGYEFDNWTVGEETITENPYKFTVTADVSLVANFKEKVVAPTKLYLTPNANWKQSNARFAAYFFGNGETWVSMTKVAGETDLYEVTIPTDKKYPNVIFCRMNPGTSANNWNDGVKWNQTADLVIPADGKNHYTVKAGTWDKGGGTWSIWPVPVVKTYKDITITVIANATPKIHYWEGGDKMVGSSWENKPEMVATGEENTYSYTIKDVDEATGVKYLVVVGDIQSADQITSVNVTKNFKEFLPQVAVQGVNNWDGTDKMTVSDDYQTASITLSLAANKAYELKLTVNDGWFGGKTIAITRDKNSAKFDTNGDGNGKITTDLAGGYVFTYTYATKTLTVAYPVSVTATAENGTVEGAGTYTHGTEVTLIATPADGYEFVNWTAGKDTVSTEATYTFTVEADVNLVANFQEVVPVITHTVTFDYSVDAGYITVNDNRISEKKVTYEEGTVLTVKALTFDNYRFNAWADEEGVDIVNTPEYTFTVTADVVLKAIITYVPGAVGTGVENNNVVTSETMKVIQNGRLFIIREGKIYNAQGQVVK